MNNAVTGTWQPNDVELLNSIMSRTKATTQAQKDINKILGEW